MGEARGFGGRRVENDLNPCPRAAAEMAAFDRLPEDLRRFVAFYPRGAKSRQIERLLWDCGGRVADAMDEIRFLLPARRQ